jgi:hypothetical protein
MARIIGQTLCDACGGSGTEPDQRPCQTCGGTGLVFVLETGRVIAFTERRRWPRYQFNLPVKISPTKPSFAGGLVGRTTEVNEGGLTINAGVPLNVGDELELELLPPYFGPPLKVRSAIRDAAGDRYGVEFLPADLSEEHQLKAFRQFLQSGIRPPA